MEALKNRLRLRSAKFDGSHFSDWSVRTARTLSQESPWLPPATAIICAIYVCGLLLLPFSGVTARLPLAKFAAGWLFFMAFVAGTGWLALLVKLVLQREPAPIAAMVRWFLTHRPLIASTALGLGLVGLMSMGFGWVKSQLDYVFPFWADRLWADLDHMIFGADPVFLLRERLGHSIVLLDFIYSLWYPATILSLTGVFLRRHSQAIVAYFIVWGVFGLVVQAVGSSAGPIFWERIGLGHRFDGVLDGLPIGSKLAADYLWDVYANGSVEVASGISAMPSLHVAMAAWIAIAYARTPAAPIGLLYWACVFTGSVALGWHYFMDGFVGSLCAIASYAIAGRYLKDKQKR